MALPLFNDVPLRTRRAPSLYKIYGKSALPVLNSINTAVLKVIAHTILVQIVKHAKLFRKHPLTALEHYTWARLIDIPNYILELSQVLIKF